MVQPDRAGPWYGPDRRVGSEFDKFDRFFVQERNFDDLVAVAQPGERRGVGIAGEEFGRTGLQICLDQVSPVQGFGRKRFAVDRQVDVSARPVRTTVGAWGE